MIDPGVILDKLKLNNLSAISNILKDDQLCSRIILEDPVSIDTFLKEKIISNTYLKKLVDGKLISSFSNTATRGVKRFIFRNELAPFLDKQLVYDKSVLNNLRETNEYIISILDNGLNQQQCDVLNLYLLEFGNKKAVEKFSKKYKVSIVTTKEIFSRTFAEIKRKSWIYRNFVKDLDIKRDKLIDDVKVLTQLKDSLYKRVSYLKEKNQLDDNTENLEILGSDFCCLNFPLRADNILHKMGLRTVQDVLEIPLSYLKNRPGMGEATIKKMQTKLAEHNLHLRSD